MNYKQSLEYLYERLPMFQRVGAAAIKKDLTNTLKMLEAIGNPHQHLKSVHIAGTNGKGTSAHAIAAILQCAGYKTGLYTSPHLKSFTERIRINGEEVDKEYISDFVTGNQALIESVNPSFFEVTVAMAFDYFRAEQVDIAVIETGLGGRLDSTNVIDPEVALITMIGWDHADLLGDSLELIAREKAGIMKPGKPVIIGADQPELLTVFQEQAARTGATLITTSDYSCMITEKSPKYQVLDVCKSNEVVFQKLCTDITADYFISNIPGILSVCEVLSQTGWHIDEKAIYEGFSTIKKTSGLKGRWNVLSEKPFVIADISHNEPGLESLFRQVSTMDFEHIHLIFGVVKDKDLAKILPLLPTESVLYFTQSHIPRSMSAMELMEQALALGIGGTPFENVNDAIAEAKKKASNRDLILICGSTFVVAEIEAL